MTVQRVYVIRARSNDFLNRKERLIIISLVNFVSAR